MECEEREETTRDRRGYGDGEVISNSVLDRRLRFRGVSRW
jgi:hypothetical protein